ncbi:SDR family oxidoreductase [Asaia astilbis]|uniref:SDR family oxidoreductase n=1 Tax=Asaia astilbis TaxID=610244 RepID=UPI00046EDDBD|nr:SDR family oxidoreductase [Asaia astilbis]
MNRFQNKNILITGGTSGIGLAGARRIIAEGGHVVITGSNEEKILPVRRELGAQAQIARNDASDQTASALIEIVDSVGELHGVWFNAGIATLGFPEELDAALFDKMMATNVRGPMLQLAALSPKLASGASVVLTASSSVYEGAAATGLYAATKGALIAMARSWATALASRGIRVNVLVPGPIETGFRDFMPDKVREGFEAFVLNQVPLKRVGTPEEAAAVALFLLSDEASFVTGSQYAVDGGLVML